MARVVGASSSRASCVAAAGALRQQMPYSTDALWMRERVVHGHERVKCSPIPQLSPRSLVAPQAPSSAASAGHTASLHALPPRQQQPSLVNPFVSPARCGVAARWPQLLQPHTGSPPTRRRHCRASVRARRPGARPKSSQADAAPRAGAPLRAQVLRLNEARLPPEVCPASAVTTRATYRPSMVLAPRTRASPTFRYRLLKFVS